VAETSAQLSCSLSLQPSSVEIDPQSLLTLITLVEPFLTLLNVAPLHDTVASHLLHSSTRGSRFRRRHNTRQGSNKV